MRVPALILGMLTLVSPAAGTTVPAIPAALSLPGTWSFDGSCASGDGMQLIAGGKASYDEWGSGLWALADGGKRIVLIMEDISEEADRRKVAELIEFRITAGMGNKMALIRASDGAKINAVKCKAQ